MELVMPGELESGAKEAAATSPPGAWAVAAPFACLSGRPGLKAAL